MVGARVLGFGFILRPVSCVLISAFPRAKLKRKEGRLADALAPRGDEGRGTLREAMGSREQALIHGYPNGETRPLWVIPD